MKKLTLFLSFFLAGCLPEKRDDSKFNMESPNGQLEVFVNELKHTDLPTWLEPTFLHPTSIDELPPSNCNLQESKVITSQVEKITPTSTRETFTSYVKIGQRVIFISGNKAQENGKTYLLSLDLESELSIKCGFYY